MRNYIRGEVELSGVMSIPARDVLESLVESLDLSEILTYLSNDGLDIDEIIEESINVSIDNNGSDRIDDTAILLVQKGLELLEHSNNFEYTFTSALDRASESTKEGIAKVLKEKSLDHFTNMNLLDELIRRELNKGAE